MTRAIGPYIGAQVWKQQGDIRDVISTGRLVRKTDGSKQIIEIMNTMMKYGREEKGGAEE